MPISDVAQLQKNLVSVLKANGDLHDPAVEAAFLAVPRHAFLPEIPLEQAYANQSILLKRQSDGSAISTISQPSMIAQMLEQLALVRGLNVLEIGTATGYNAALITHIVGEGRVTSVEMEADLIEHAERNLQRIQMRGAVSIVQGDGAAGYAPRASYDRIISTANVYDVPPAWERQLKPSGVLVTPIWLEALQVSAAFRFEPGGTLYSDHNLPCWFVHLRGVDAMPDLSERVGSTSLELTSSQIERIDGGALQSFMSDWAEINYFDRPLTWSMLFAGFIPYMTIHLPLENTMAFYTAPEDIAPYGVSGTGFALIAQGSACFIPLDGRGAAHCFGASDAFMTTQQMLTDWMAAGQPTIDRLRLRLHPRGALTSVSQGRLFPRKNHDLHAWLEPA